MTAPDDGLVMRVQRHLNMLYPDAGRDARAALCERLLDTFGLLGSACDTTSLEGLPGADEVVLITYANTIRDGDEIPLRTLGRLWRGWLASSFSTMHVLPFFPSSSDGGFAVVDYEHVDAASGDWSDLADTVGTARLMVDLVCNHCSASSDWFSDFVADRPPGRSFFKTASPSDDLSAVVRPRTHDLLLPVETSGGLRHAWATFSHDQIDLDFANPDVLVEFCKILRLYLDRGATRVRLDAIAYLWKQVGTSCIHLPQTHEVVKLMRTLIEHRDPSVLLITETNVPHRENVSYLGQGDEAHVVYNFTLSPLIVSSLINGSAAVLTAWLTQLEPLPEGTTFLNFLASHDGIGLRPIEDLVSAEQLAELLDAATAVGGDWSPYATSTGERPYELNVSLVDLLAGPGGETSQRHLLAHAIMLAVQGIPAIYIHSMLMTHGDHATVAKTRHRRDINRSRVNIDDAEAWIATGWRAALYADLTALIATRRQCDAFAPKAAQVVHGLHPQTVVIERRGATSTVLAVHNVGPDTIEVDLSRFPLVAGPPENAPIDLLTSARAAVRAGLLTLDPWQACWLDLSADAQ